MVSNIEKNTVLFVDDEENILKSLKRGLMREPYQKLFASSGKEALEVMKTNQISVIVTDMRMPGMTGLELLREIKDLYPDTVKIVLSGYTHLPQILATINQVDIFKFITKPWDLENEFKRVINEAIAYYNVKFENELLRKSVSKKNELYQKLLKSNDEKLRGIKLDFKEVFRIQSDTYKYLASLCQKRCTGELDFPEYEMCIDQTTEIFDAMPHYFPSEFSEMKIVQFAEEINRIVFNINHPEVKFDPTMHARQVGFVGVEKIMGTFRGNFKLLLFVLKKVFSNILKSHAGNIYNIVMKQGEVWTDKGDFRCKLTFLIDETMPNHELNNEVRTTNVIVLDHLMQSLGGGLQLSYKGDKIVTILELELEVKFDAGMEPVIETVE